MTIALYRILGNDLWPHHGRRQTVRNLSFLLEHEPDLPGCEKRFVVNRIFDRRAEEEIMAILRSAGHDALHIPFRMGDYAAAARDVGVTEEHPLHRELRDPDHAIQHNKTRYATNVNAARNTALEEGWKTARWVLPLDGHCVFDRRGWEALRDRLEHEERPHVAIPMVRLRANAEYFDFDPAAFTEDEPQVALRDDTPPRPFHEGFRWSRLDKVELLNRLELLRPGSLLARDETRAGYVVRLESGAPSWAGGQTVDGRVTQRRYAERLMLLRLDRALLGTSGMVRQRLAQRRRRRQG